jgi:hypothetical protein
MSYDFTPMTDEEINCFHIIEEGIYDFEVIKCTRKISKSGNAMAEIQINIWDKNGKTSLIYDYLVFSTVPLNIKKVKHFCDTVGLQDAYKKGSLPEDLERLSGEVLIGIKEEQPKGDGTFYPKKNFVVDYIGKDKKELEDKKEVLQDDFYDSSIPF